MLMTQLMLWRNLPEGQRGIATLTTWVKTDSRIKPGSVLTLKGDPNQWTVSIVYEGEHDLSEIENRSFDNNNYDKHKGLGI